MSAPTKSAVRSEILSQRKALSAEENAARSQAVGRQFVRILVQHHRKIEGLKIGLYRSLPFEVELTELIIYFELKGASLYFPKVQSSGSDAKKMEFLQVSPSDRKIDWQKGTYGTEEPSADLPVVSPEELDLIIVPGVAFGCSFERVGMGGGYYDRYLARAKQALKVALTFDFQVFDKIEQDPWDQKMDWIFGEKLDIKSPKILDWLNKNA